MTWCSPGGSEFARRAARFEPLVGAIALEEGFFVNHRKTRSMRAGVQQHMLGLVTNMQPAVSRVDATTRSDLEELGALRTFESKPRSASEFPRVSTRPSKLDKPSLPRARAEARTAARALRSSSGGVNHRVDAGSTTAHKVRREARAVCMSPASTLSSISRRALSAPFCAARETGRGAHRRETRGLQLNARCLPETLARIRGKGHGSTTVTAGPACAIVSKRCAGQCAKDSRFDVLIREAFPQHGPHPTEHEPLHPRPPRVG